MTNFYICTHKDFEVPKELKGNYTIVTDGTDLQNKYDIPILKADNELLPLKHSYSEGYMIYDIWKKDSESDFIGLNHYRRHLQIQEVEDNIEENVLPVPMAFDMYLQYGQCHNIDDLLEVKAIIDKYYKDFNTNVQGFLPCNISILDRATFNEWCDFLFGVLEIFNERKSLYTDEDVRFHCWKNGKKYLVPFNLDYQSRLHAFLMERITTIYLANKFNHKPIRYSQIVMGT